MLQNINNNHAGFWRGLERRYEGNVKAKKGFVLVVSALTYLGMRMGGVDNNLSSVATTAVGLYAGRQLNMHLDQIGFSVLKVLIIGKIESARIGSSNPKITAMPENDFWS